MVIVKKYKRRSINGNPHYVNSHIRRVKHKRGNYNIRQDRQLSAPKEAHGWDNDFFYDRLLTANYPGKRESINKKTYYERRFNRSDKSKAVQL